jgi:hypothetical protein
MKLHEIINLYYELNGVTKQTAQRDEVISQGILKQKMSLKNKVYLQRLNKLVSDEVKLYEDAKKELFEKYGTKGEAGLVVEKENMEALNKEHMELLTAEKSVDVAALWGADLTLKSLEDIETTEYYPQLFNLIDSK